jgi:hypothetical protein
MKTKNLINRVFKTFAISLFTIAISSCGFSSTSCELAVREKYEGKSMWVKNYNSFHTIVLTKDSALIHIFSNGLIYPYFSKVDTLGKFSKTSN